MKGPAAGVGILLLALGALLIWAGFQGVSLLEVVRDVLSGNGLPKAAGSDVSSVGTKVGGSLGKITAAGADAVTEDKSTTGPAAPITSSSTANGSWLQGVTVGQAGDTR